VKYKDITRGIRKIALRERNTSLEEAAARVQASLVDGTICPCCGQICKLYPRKLNSTMARGLIWMVREFERTGRWICVPEKAPRFVLKTKEYGTLAHWGLVEPRPNDDPSKKRSGYWRPTQKGIDFVYRRRMVPSHVFLYNNRVRKVSTTHIYIDEALASHFDYSELMRGEQ